MRRRSLSTFLVVVALAGCGGHARRAARPVQPKLSRELAIQLATSSDGVAQRLDAGDSCAALAAARGLERQTIAAIQANRVPGPLQEGLLGTVNDLVGRIGCVQPAPPEEKHRGKDHGDHGGGGDGGG